MVNRKTIGILLLILSFFSFLPLSAVIAELALKGDPEIICVASNISMPVVVDKISSFSEIVLSVDVQLLAKNLPADFVNATLRFKDENKLRDYYTLTDEKNNPEIVTAIAFWTNVGIDEAKSPLHSFAITGFNRVPRSIAFLLDLSYTNPHDKETYSKTIGIESLFDDTTIDIITVSNPPDKYKEQKIPISVTIKNTGSHDAIGIVFWIKIQSRYAKDLSVGYRNDDGNIIFTQIFTFASDTISPGAQKVYNIDFHYAHSNGAMNVGEWKVFEVAAQASNSNVAIESCNKLFDVNAKSLGSGPHAVFIYYLWNGIGSFAWNENPRPYFEHTTYGEVRAGLYMFKKQYNQRSDNYIDLNMIICKEDSNWESPGTMDAIRTSAKNHVGTVLNTVDGNWKVGDDALYIDNCGFDLLLVVSSRSVGGYAPSDNFAIASKSGSSTYSGDWKYNIDGLVQHEVSHCFGTLDYHNDHSLIKCIMVYKFVSIFNWVNYLYERVYGIVWSGCIHDPTNNWCTSSGSCNCSYKFSQNWDQFDEPVWS